MNTIEELYKEKLYRDPFGDLNEHLHVLRRYATNIILSQQCVVEFGVRTGQSTAAFLAGNAWVYSYDINEPQFTPTPDVADLWHFEKADTSQLKFIPECDVLFIDSLHCERQVKAELKHHVSVRKYIILHDTLEWGQVGDNGEKGINFALFPFLADNRLTWRIREHHNNCRGLTVLERYGPKDSA